MTDIRLSNRAMRDMDEMFKLKIEALDIFQHVVSEWKSDPTSVQCFDLRIVNRAIEIDAMLKKLDVLYRG